MSDFEPKIIVFRCNWSSPAGADRTDASGSKSKPRLRTIRTMCSGRVDPTFVLKAFGAGADGVMMVGCHAGDCHYVGGNYKAMRMLTLLKNMLPQFGIEPERLRLEWVKTAEGAKFQSALDEFTDKVAELGPCRAS